MATTADIVYRLTEANLGSAERQRSLRDFADATGWFPSDQMVDYRGTETFTNGHLLVEHGMANTAVISFFNSTRPYGTLERHERIRLLELSYNNLVDWHLLPDMRGLTAVYNRTDPPRDFRFEGHDKWRAEAFDVITDQHVRPELKALDDAFVSTVSFWKRAIAADLGRRATNERLAALFNVLIFIRALEDHRRRLGGVPDRLLVDLMAATPPPPLAECCQRALRQLGKRVFPASIQAQADELGTFDQLDPATVRQLVGDFYSNRYSPYTYDFSLISKHALSRIYEHYVSVLRQRDSDQFRFFPEMPEEISNRELGSYYTPQYIARFFARYLRENTTPKQFREMRVIDPACGSGIFLRTMLELRCDPLDLLGNTAAFRNSFANVTGLDIDPAACEAARLSLSLLHLVLTDEFPRHLNIFATDAVEYVRDHPNQQKGYGAVVANPPYVKWDAQPASWRKMVAEYLGPLARGKVDIYIAMVKAGLDLLSPGGFAMYVLPHSFLFANSAGPLRQFVKSSCWVRLLADLSDVKVFEDTNSYTILVVLQRKIPSQPEPRATIIRCRAAVGSALSTALQGKTADSDAYRIFECGQESFGEQTWTLLPPAQHAFLGRLQQFPTLDRFFSVHQGVITGADSIFVRPAGDVPPQEQSIWRPLLPDRDMLPYAVPETTSQSVFYPYVDGTWLDEGGLRHRFPLTWAYLQQHEKVLTVRRSIHRGQTPWWKPMRLRDPDTLYRPKIICPHLMFAPRFGLDLLGRFVVSRSPYIVTAGAERRDATDTLKYLLAVLNSSVGFWQTTVASHKYARQYAMLENKTLNRFRLPDPDAVAPHEMRNLIELVDARISDGFSSDRERAIEAIVFRLYSLSHAEATLLGIT
jgi:tRNA1(Val) A37 N6-methylase TrmN6